MNNKITVSALIDAPITRVWECWSNPEHITRWTFASDDWEAPFAENDLRIDGKFKTRMQSKEGNQGFDFTGTYTDVKEHKLIEYLMDDGRKVSVQFEDISSQTRVTETFDPESQNPAEMQRDGWQAILNNFKKYVENGGQDEEDRY